MPNSLFLSLLFAVPTFVAAQTNAEKVFGKWEKISIEEIKRPVREYEYERVSLGAVTNEYQPVKQPLCTLAEKGYIGSFPCRRNVEILTY